MKANFNNFLITLLCEATSDFEKKYPDIGSGYIPTTRLRNFIRDAVRETQAFAMGGREVKQNRKWWEAVTDYVFQCLDDSDFPDATTGDIKRAIWIELGRQAEDYK